jgi:hypothetical protein
LSGIYGFEEIEANNWLLRIKYLQMKEKLGN